MYSTTDVTGYGESILKRFLELSNRISIYSLPMKPFIRFGKGMDDIYLSDISKNKNIFWDFDDVLQKMLLGIFKAIATPEQVAHLCVESWKVILKDFADKKQKQLNELIESKQPFQYKYTARDEFICKEVQAGSRFLYVGCGSGSDCLRFAHRGYKVVGIDTNSKLINIAQQWADYLALPFQPLCMDVMELGFDQESFDSFLTMYGQQPSLYQSLVLQRNLSRILRKGGRGFVIANRKKYSSYMALMSSRYPTAMNS